MPAASLMREGLVSAAVFAASIGVHRSAVHRWLTAGLRSGGEVVRLEGVRRGGVWFTTSAAYSRFLDVQTAAALAEPADTPTPARRSKAASAERAAVDAWLAAK